jgi:hypothetical protein
MVDERPCPKGEKTILRLKTRTSRGLQRVPTKFMASNEENVRRMEVHQ